MAVVTATELFDISISYFNGVDQLIPFRGYYIEGTAPYVPEDDAPGWVCFELETDDTVDGFFAATTELARRLFMDLGFTSDQVILLMEDF